MDISEALMRQWEITSCWCQECCKKETGYYNLVHLVVCPNCGNKRCPRASSCKLECTNSNEPGQKGSIYQDVPISELAQDPLILCPVAL